MTPCGHTFWYETGSCRHRHAHFLYFFFFLPLYITEITSVGLKWEFKLKSCCWCNIVPATSVSQQAWNTATAVQNATLLSRRKSRYTPTFCVSGTHRGSLKLPYLVARCSITNATAMTFSSQRTHHKVQAEAS